MGCEGSLQQLQVLTKRPTTKLHRRSFRRIIAHARQVRVADSCPHTNRLLEAASFAYMSVQHSLF